MSVLLAANAVVALAAFVQASVGIGFAMIAVPLLLLVNPALVPVPVLFAMLVLSVAMLAREHRHVDRSSLVALVPGLVMGTVAGTALLPFLPERSETVFAALIIGAVAWSLVGPPVPVTRSTSLAAGAVAGMIGTLAGLHGPALALVYQRHTLASARATIAGVFVLASSLSIAAVVGTGMADGSAIQAGAWLLPGTATGLVVAMLFPPPPPRTARTGMLAVAGASGLLLLF